MMAIEKMLSRKPLKKLAKLLEENTDVSIKACLDIQKSNGQIPHAVYKHQLHKKSSP